MIVDQRMNYKSRKLLARILMPMGEEDQNDEISSVDSSELADDVNRSNLLILDCRPFLSFSDGHITGAVNVHCPSILRRRFRGQCLPLRTIVPSAEIRDKLIGHCNSTADMYDTVVLYDDKSSDWNGTEDSMLKLVAKCLQFEERTFDIHYLTGGFKRFRQMCPNLCSIKSASTPVFGTKYNLANIQENQINSSVLKSNSNNGQTPDVPVEILPYLYLGNASHASRKDTLKLKGVTALLNVSPRTCPNHFEGIFRYKCIHVDDIIGADIGVWFKEAITFIDAVCESGGKVLVHCHAGVSRSATICVAYLMYKHRIHLDEAFEFVRSKRSVIAPNWGFMEQLLQFESQVFSSSQSSPTSQQQQNKNSTSTIDNVDSSSSSSQIIRPSSLPSNLTPSCQQIFNFDFNTSCPVLPTSSPIFKSFCSTPPSILSPS